MVVLDDAHFRLLETFMSHVKASGVSDVLAINGEFISSLSHGMQGPVASAISILRALKDLDMILSVLWKAVKNGLSMAQKELLPVTRHHGILSLPLEIVAQVLQQVHESDPDYATQSIPLVNHYFHDIAIGTPKLWTCLVPVINPELYMKRSKPLGLEVVLLKCPTYTRFLEMVAPEAERWTSLSIPSHNRLDNAMDKWTCDVLAGKTFAALRKLRIEGGNDDSDSFYSSWKMPSLRILKLKNKLPSIQPATLTCLHLHIGDSDSWCHMSISLDAITTFLRTVPWLTELSLVIGWFDTITFFAETEATLPNVKTLRLIVKAQGKTDSSLTDFLASLRTPNLSDMSVDVTTRVASQLTRWISVIFPKQNSFWSPLESLDLSMSYRSRNYDECDEEWVGTSVPDDLFKRIPASCHLSIRADGVDPPLLAYGIVQLPHLRTLCFRNCNEFDTGFISDIGNIFEAPGFETLKIHDCKKIDTEAVRKMMPEGKAFESTVDWDVDITML